MRKFTCFLILYVFFTGCANAQVDTIFTGKLRHRITIYTLSGDAKNGILMRTSDSSVFIYPGNFREWKQQKTFPIALTPYYTINKNTYKEEKWYYKRCINWSRHRNHARIP